MRHNSIVNALQPMALLIYSKGVWGSLANKETAKVMEPTSLTIANLFPVAGDHHGSSKESFARQINAELVII